MPFTKDDYILFLDTRTQDSNLGRFTDETPYGAPNQERADQANILLVAKMDEKENLTFLTGIDNTTPLTALNWTFPTLLDGAYRAFLINPFNYDNAETYDKQEVDENGVITQYADVIYHIGSQTFYKCIGDDVVGIQPSVTTDWEDSWEVFTDFESYILSDRDTITIHIHDDTVTFKFEDCLKDELSAMTDEILCGVCDKWEDLLKVVQMTLVLDETTSQNWRNKQTRAEVIITEGTKKFCC